MNADDPGRSGRSRRAGLRNDIYNIFQNVDLRKFFLKNVVSTILVIGFFAGIIIRYYTLLYEETREGIIKDGKISAIRSVDLFEEYLSVSIDMVNFTAPTLDDLIKEKEPDPEIQKFLVRQSKVLGNLVEANETGIYGYINGKFFSGTGWVPPDDYSPTERPWYTKPMSDPGNMTILDPYVDVQTGNTMLALGKTLCDNVSVISVDISLKDIQRMTEEAARLDEADIEMVISGEGKVVTCSDSNEIEKDYKSEKDTFGAEILKHLNNSEENVFEFDYGNVHYIGYAALFQNDWHSVYLRNSTDIFGHLSKLLISTIIVLIASVLVIILIMTDLLLRGAAAENLNRQISSIANIYMTVHEYDFSTDSAKTFREDKEIFRKFGIDKYEQPGLVLKKVMEAVGDEHYLEDIMRFIDLSTLKDRLADKETIAIEYKNEEGLWRRTRFIASGRDPAGNLTRVLWVYEDIDVEKKERDKLVDISERALAASEAKTKFLSQMSHEIRTPINAVTGMNEMILRECRDEKILEYSENIKTAGKTLMSLVDEILNFSRIDEEGAAGKSDNYRVRFVAPKACVLVVDDTEMNLEVFLNLLKETRLEIDTAGNGDEALALTRKKKYDLLFFDHMMPGKDGIETLKEMREQKDNKNLETKVICLTANAVSGAREYYISEGFDDYLTKPLDAGRLEGMLIKYLPEEKIEVFTVEDEDPGNETEIPEELDFLKNRSEINIYEGLKNSGSYDSYLSVLRIFYTSLDTKTEELNRFFSEGDIKNYTIVVHAMKSSARIIGAIKLSEEAERLEYAGKSQDRDYIAAHNPDLICSCLCIKEILTGLPKEKERNDKPEADEALMEEVYSEIRRAADEMDCDLLQNIFKDMADYSIPKKHKEKWKYLKHASEQYDYEAILVYFDKETENEPLSRAVR